MSTSAICFKQTLWLTKEEPHQSDISHASWRYLKRNLLSKIDLLFFFFHWQMTLGLLLDCEKRLSSPPPVEWGMIWIFFSPSWRVLFSSKLDIFLLSPQAKYFSPPPPRWRVLFSSKLDCALHLPAPAGGGAARIIREPAAAFSTALSPQLATISYFHLEPNFISPKNTISV